MSSLSLRYACFCMLFSTVGASAVHSQSRSAPLDHTTPILADSLAGGSTPATMVRDALLHEAMGRFEQWRVNYEARTDLDDIAAYQARMKQEFISRIGGLPEPEALNPKITGTIRRNGYTVEKILFESQPQFYVTAGLFLPDPAKFPPPWPAVVVVCGHSAEGKLQDGYQRGSALAALNGLAAMIVDPIGQGERLQILDEAGSSPKLSPTTEHTLVGTAAILVGWNTARWMIGDAMAAVDYLQSRSDIQGEKIGCMGNSGGGTQTSYMMALDERIYAAAPSCYITSFRNLLQTIGPQDAEQNIYGQIALGMDHADYVMMRAPKPTLIACATHDFFDIGGAWNTFRDAKRLYHRFGEGRKVELVEVDAPHGWHPLQRRASVQFMVEHLARRVGDVLDPEVEPLTADEMNVTQEGQVLRLPGAVSAFDHVRMESERLSKLRATAHASPEALRQVIRQTAGIAELNGLPAPTVNLAEKFIVGEMSLQRLTLQVDERIWLPAVLARPAMPGGAVAKQGTCLFPVEGIKAFLADSHELTQRVSQGEVVLIVDSRGTGETEPAGKRWYNQRFGVNGGNAVTAYLLGKSLVGLRAQDCMVVSRWLAAAEGVERVHWVASGEMTIPALHAAALENQLVDSLEVRRGLTAWADVIETPLSENQVPSLVHAALQSYDLPDLVRLLGKPVSIVEPHDATDKPVLSTGAN